MRSLIVALLILVAPIACAADLLTTWEPATTDDTGQPLASIDEYRVYACGGAEPLAVVPGAETELLEAGVVAGTGTYCREVAAYVAPFEGDRTQGVLVVVVPGAPTSVNVQAIQ